MDSEGDTEARIIRPAKGPTDTIETVSGHARLETWVWPHCRMEEFWSAINTIRLF